MRAGSKPTKGKQPDIKVLFSPTLFWDAAQIDPERHAWYVIARVLDFGDMADVHRLREIYGDEQIARVVRCRRGLSPRTGKYWAVRLGIPVREVECLRKYYPRMPSRR